MKYLLPCLMLFLFTNNAYSWGSFGHQTVGEIAERFLTPEAQIAITDIIGPEKIALASVWPDDVRDDSSFDSFKPYHFISIDSDNNKNAMTVLNKFPAVLSGKEVNRSVKMMALKYLIHVVGDVHQPLHVGSKLDSGGNTCMVAWNADQVLNLHEIWDGKIIDYDVNRLKKISSPLKNYNFTHYATEIIKSHPLSSEDILNIQSIDFTQWTKESNELAQLVYPILPASSYCQKGATEFPLITEDYKIKAAEKTQLRLLYGGLRLANLLNTIFKNGTNPGVNTSMSKSQILEKLNLTNEEEKK